MQGLRALHAAQLIMCHSGVRIMPTLSMEMQLRISPVSTKSSPDHLSADDAIRETVGALGHGRGRGARQFPPDRLKLQ